MTVEMMLTPRLTRSIPLLVNSPAEKKHKSDRAGMAASKVKQAHQIQSAVGRKVHHSMHWEGLGSGPRPEPHEQAQNQRCNCVERHGRVSEITLCETTPTHSLTQK